MKIKKAYQMINLFDKLFIIFKFMFKLRNIIGIDLNYKIEARYDSNKYIRRVY